MMTRAHAWLVVAVSLAASAGTAFGETQAEIAAHENEEGRDLMYASKYDEASAKFRSAVARVPEAKYFFNLCTSLYQEGKYGEALTACNSADKNSSEAGLKDKVSKMTGKITEEAHRQGLDLQPVGGGGGDPNQPPLGDPNQPPPNPNQPYDPNQSPPGPGPGPQVMYRPVQGRPPEGAGVFMAVKPDHTYTWTLGVDLLGGGGQVGDGRYGSAAFTVRGKADYLFDRRHRVGVEGFVQYTQFTQGSGDRTGFRNLDTVDIGAALYKHFCAGRGHICLTPLVGASIALMSPNAEGDGDGSELFNYLGVGGRGEVSLAYAFGRRLEHVVSVMGGVQVYSPVVSSSDSRQGDAMDVGLDTAGAFGYLGVGYTYRFNTPIGRSPFITLY